MLFPRIAITRKDTDQILMTAMKTAAAALAIAAILGAAAPERASASGVPVGDLVAAELGLLDLETTIISDFTWTYSVSGDSVKAKGVGVAGKIELTFLYDGYADLLTLGYLESKMVDGTFLERTYYADGTYTEESMSADGTKVESGHYADGSSKYEMKGADGYKYEESCGADGECKTETKYADGSKDEDGDDD